MDDTQLYDVQVARRTTTCSCGAGRRSSTPTRCCRTSRALRSRPTPTTPGYNDANWCSEEYDELYEQQKVGARSRAARARSCTRCCGCSTASPRTSCCSRTPTCRPTAPTASRVGCSSRPRPGRCCSPTRRPRTSTSRRSRRRWRDDDGIAASRRIIGRGRVLGGATCRRQESSSRTREHVRAGSSSAGVGRWHTAFVVVFNFFLFRVVNDDPVDKLFRGRNLTPGAARRHARSSTSTGRSSTSSSAYVGADAAGQPRRLVHQQPAGDDRDPRSAVADDHARRHGDVAVDGDRHRLGIYAGWRRRSAFDAGRRRSRCSPTRCPTSGSAWCCSSLFSVQLGWFPTGGFEDPGSTTTGLAALLDQAAPHGAAGAHAALAYIGEYMIVMRSSMIETLTRTTCSWPAQGPARRRVRRRHAVPNALLPVVSLSALNFGFVFGRDRGRGDLLVAGPRPGDARGDPRPRLPDVAGSVPAVQRGDDRRQPGRRPDCTACSTRGSVADERAERALPDARRRSSAAPFASRRAGVVAAVRGFGVGVPSRSPGDVGLVVLIGVRR